MSLAIGKPKLTVDENSLANADAICKIIRAATNSGIREIKIGALFMAFGPLDQAAPQPLDTVETKSVEQETKHILEQTHLQDEMDQLKLSDPLAYERLVEGELEGASP